MQTPIDPRLAQSGPYRTSSRAAGTAKAELSAALVSMDANATPFDDHIYGARTLEPGVHHDDFDSFLSSIDPQLNAGLGLGPQVPGAHEVAFEPQSAAAPLEANSLQAGDGSQAYAIQGAAAAQTPQLELAQALAASSNLHHPAATPLLNAHPGAGYSSNVPQIGHVRPQQGAAHHGQGWLGNHQSTLHSHTQPTGLRTRTNAARATTPGFPTSITAHQQAHQRRIAGYPNAQSQHQLQQLQYQNNQWQQRQAHHLSTRGNTRYGIAASAAQTNMAATPVYQNQPPRGQQLHQVQQAFTHSTMHHHHPAPPMYSANPGPLKSYMAGPEYPAHEAFPDPSFGATFPYGQHPSAGARTHAGAYGGGPAPASSAVNQFPEYMQSRSLYPPPDIATQQIPAYGSLNTDPSLQVYAQTQAPCNKMTMVHPRNNAQGNGPENEADGPKGNGQGYPSENKGGEMAGSEDFNDELYRLHPTAQMVPAMGFNEPPVITSPPVSWPRLGHHFHELDEPMMLNINGHPTRLKESERGRVAATRRMKNVRPELCDPRFFYYTLKEPPRGFGFQTGIGLHQFSYPSGVQLAVDKKYSAAEIAKFLKGRDGQEPCKLRVQAVPSQSKSRLSKEDCRCRWKGCRIPSNLITPGWYRVAFDEFQEPTDNGTLDPYQMAGMMHLWCFEQCFNIVDFFNSGRLVAENRTLVREEKNLMALTRGSNREMITKTYLPWFKERNEKDVPHDGPWTPRPHQDSLSCALTRHHLDHQTKARHNSRSIRRANKAKGYKKTHGVDAEIELDGSTIDVHLGDLKVYAAFKHPTYQPEEEVEVVPNDGKPGVSEARLATAADEKDDAVELGIANRGGDQAMACPEGFSPLTLYIEQNVPGMVQAGQTANAQRLGHAPPKRKREEPEPEPEPASAEEAAGRVSKRARTDHQQQQRLHEEAPRDQAGQELAGHELAGQELAGSDDLFGEEPGGETLPALDGQSDHAPATLGEHLSSDIDVEYLYGSYDDSLFTPGQEHQDFAHFLDDETFK